MTPFVEPEQNREYFTNKELYTVHRVQQERAALHPTRGQQSPHQFFLFKPLTIVKG
jgi:hypothetical protein